MNARTQIRPNRSTKVKLVFSVIYILIGFHVVFEFSQFLNPPLDSELQTFTATDVSIQCDITAPKDLLVVTINTTANLPSIFYLEGCQAASPPIITGKTAKLFNDELWALEYNGFQKVTYERTRAKRLLMPLMALFALLPIVIIIQLLLMKAVTKEDKNRTNQKSEHRHSTRH